MGYELKLPYNLFVLNSNTDSNHLSKFSHVRRSFCSLSDGVRCGIHERTRFILPLEEAVFTRCSVTHSHCAAVHAWHNTTWTSPPHPNYWGRFNWHELTLIPAWISSHMPSKIWEDIIYPFPNVNGATDAFPNFIMDQLLIHAGIKVNSCQ